MTIRTSYTQARANLAELLDKVTRDGKTVMPR